MAGHVDDDDLLDRLYACHECGDLFERRPDRRGRPELYCSPPCKTDGRNRNRRRNTARAKETR